MLQHTHTHTHTHPICKDWGINIYLYLYLYIHTHIYICMWVYMDIGIDIDIWFPVFKEISIQLLTDWTITLTTDLTEQELQRSHTIKNTNFTKLFQKGH